MSLLQQKQRGQEGAGEGVRAARDITNNMDIMKDCVLHSNIKHYCMLLASGM